MIQLIGKENCSRCEMVKNILKEKNIEFTYTMLNDLPEQEKKDILSQARVKGLMNMPLIIKDNNMVELKEVIS